jgi:DNA repair protein RecO (recombination protein O)
MPRPRVYSTDAVVLRQRKLGEADRIVTLYTANLGKVEAVAKGVRKAKSRLAGHVEPLTQGTFQLAHGRTLDIVTQVEACETFPAVRSDLDRLSRALYACELLDRFTEPREPHALLYSLLVDTLKRVADGGDVDRAVRFFEMALLDEMGYRPELAVCVACRAPLPAAVNYWSAALGGVLCARCVPEQAAVRPLSLNALKLLRLLLHGRFSDVARVDIDPPLATELERALLEYVRWVLERDVRSAAFIDAVRRPRAGRGRERVRAESAAPDL